MIVTEPGSISIVIPARNEASSLEQLLPDLKSTVPNAEIIVVDDGSSDSTAEVARRLGVRVVSHPYGIGNGAAIKTGARVAKGAILVFMDADGQHAAVEVPNLLKKLSDGYEMAVGARVRKSQANLHRAVANQFYNRLASWVVGHTIPDLTSGFRAVNSAKFRQYLYLLPNGFSYPTTLTMCFFRSGLPVGYVPISAQRRKGKSHLRIFRDGLRFLLIIFRITTLYSPLKLFAPASACLFAGGLAHYAYTFLAEHRFTNMSALLFLSSLLVFVIGLLSEQITNLVYRDSERP